MAASHNPSFGFDASVRSLISAVCLLGLLVLRRFINLVLPPLYSRSMVEGNPTQPHLPPYPPHSSHVKSCLDRPCHFDARPPSLSPTMQAMCSIVDGPPAVRNRNTGLVLASLWCCSRRRSEHGATPPCCGVPVLCFTQRLV